MSSEIRTEINTTRKRVEFTRDQLTILEDAWKNGMSQAGGSCLPAMTEVAAKADISLKRVKYWIGNQRAKVANKSRKMYIKEVKRPTAYTMYASTKKRGNVHGAEYFKSVAGAWRKEAPSIKLKFKEDAQNWRGNPDRDTIIKNELRKVQSAVVALDKVGYSVGGFGIDSNNPSNEKTCVRFFSTDADMFFTNEMFERYQKMFNTTDKSHEPIKPEKKVLKQQLRKHLKNCWVKSTGCQTNVPYLAIKNGSIKVDVTGFPEDMTFRDPSNYGIEDIKRLLKLPISFNILSEEEEASDIANVDVDISTSQADVLEAIFDPIGNENRTKDNVAADADVLEAIYDPIGNEHRTKDNVAADDICKLIKEIDAGNTKKKRNRTRLTIKRKRAKPKDTLYTVEEVISRKGSEVFLRWADGTTSWEPESFLVINEEN